MPRALLLRQPVGVLAGQRADEPGLAVVDVACGADRQRHRASINPSSIRIGPEPGRPRAAHATAPRPARGRRRGRASAGRATSPRPGSFPGWTTDSRTRSRAPAGAAAWIVLRIAAARSSSQSWRIVDEDVDVARAAPARRSCPRRTCSGRRGSLVAGRLGEVEDDAAEAGLPAQELDEQCPVAAADVDDRLVAVPLECGESLDPRSLPCAIARSNAARSAGCAASQRPEVGAERPRKRRRGRPSHRARRRRDARPRRRGARSRPSPSPRRSSSDAVGVRERRRAPPRRRRRRSRAHAGCGAACRRRRRPRARCPGRDAGRLRALRRYGGRRRARARASRARRAGGPRPCASGETSLIARAAATAAASSSTSSSRERAAVEQQRVRRGRSPRRAARPARRRPASSSSTAQAKLGSSASGSAPPPDARDRLLDGRRRPARRAARRGARTTSAGSSSMRRTGISRVPGRGRA